MNIKELKSQSVWGITNNSFTLVFANLKNVVKVYGIILGINLFIFTLFGVGFYFLYREQQDFSLFLSTLSSFDDLILFLKENAFGLMRNRIFVFYFFTSITVLIFTAPFQAMLYDLFIKSYLNEKWTFSLSFFKNIKRIVSILFSLLLEKILIIISFFPIYVGFIIIRIFIFFIIPVSIYENKSPFISLFRSLKLSAKSFFKLFLTYLFFLMMVFVIILVSVFLMYYIMLLLLSIIFESKANNYMFIVGILAFLPFLFLFFLKPFFVSLHVVLFFNQKIKRENFGVEYFIKKVFNKSNLFPVKKDDI